MFVTKAEIFDNLERVKSGKGLTKPLGYLMKNPLFLKLYNKWCDSIEKNSQELNKKTLKGGKKNGKSKTENIRHTKN
jgi:hypothetical protein